MKDEQKKAAMERLGRTLIAIPCWWDYNKTWDGAVERYVRNIRVYLEKCVLACVPYHLLKHVSLKSYEPYQLEINGQFY